MSRAPKKEQTRTGNVTYPLFPRNEIPYKSVSKTILAVLQVRHPICEDPRKSIRSESRLKSKEED